MMTAYSEWECGGYRVVYVVDGEERVETAEFSSLRSAADEAWALRRVGLVAWAESAR